VAVHKGRPHKIAKNCLPSPPCPKNVRTGSTPLLPCPCGHTISFEKSEVFCFKKCTVHTSVYEESALSTLDNPHPLSADVLYERPLTAANYIKFKAKASLRLAVCLAYA